MRGGLERWKRGARSHGVRQAMAYAFEGTCDSHLTPGVASAAQYADAEERTVTRFVLDDEGLTTDELAAGALVAWVDGRDPVTGEQRGRVLGGPDADLVLDGTINAPKSFSIAALLHPELAEEYERLQDRLRDRIIRAWHSELNARRGAGGRVRERLARIEVVELRHRRSRALDPHVHRHLWLGVKVQGIDGKWSNVDSRVAMRFHTVVNAEGEIAARTDPTWVAALARHGYSIGDDGEVEQLRHLVKPLSRRSNQIESNRAALVAQWRAEHDGAEPPVDVLRSIDRRAWAQGRPNKPHRFEEEDWERLAREEVADIDPAAGAAPCRPVGVRALRVAEVDVELLALRAVVDADSRSTATGGRISMFDLRAGAMRAVASSGVVGDRAALQPLIEEVEARALRHVDDLLPDAKERPLHVKAFMAHHTADLKRMVGERLDELAVAGQRPSGTVMALIAVRALGGSVTLRGRQLDAAGAIAGTDRLVSVTGPAGSGKTSMLRVAQAALRAQHRRMLVVAPTKKAATVASRETGATASSLHALLFDNGWRWSTDRTGRQNWTRLRVGETDPQSGGVYRGPRVPLWPGDRIVVDEASMVDLESANALLVLARESGAGVAMVGDHLQATPVGHAGAMAALTRRATAVVELDSIHRFRDPDYGRLTLRLRTASTKEEGIAVAAELDERGHLRRVTDRGAARAVMVDEYLARTRAGQRVALITRTNDEADALNDTIQQRRVENGELNPARSVLGADDQRILVGDVVQTRRNDRTTGVENRGLWTVRGISASGIRLASRSDPADVRFISRDYAGAYLTLAYASTVHGIQGETTDVAIVAPDIDAPGLYVGMTRGRSHNEAIVIANTSAAARIRLIDTMVRGLPEVDLADSVRAAGLEANRAASHGEPLSGPARATTGLDHRGINKSVSALIGLRGARSL